VNIKRLINWTKKNDVVGVPSVQTGFAEALMELHEEIDMDLELGRAGHRTHLWWLRKSMKSRLRRVGS